MKERIKWIDVVKGFCLLMICFSHYEFMPDGIRLLIYPTVMYRVPMFIMMSGYLYNEKKCVPFSEYAKRKTRTLLVPYLSLSAIFILLDWNTYLQSGFLGDNLYKVFVVGSGPMKASPLWFLTTLYFTTLLGYWVQKLWSRPAVLFALLAALTGVAWALSVRDMRLPWLMHLLPAAMVFYVGGTVIYKLSGYARAKCSSAGYAAMLILTMGGGISGFWLDLGDFHLNIIHNYVMFYLSPMLFTLSVSLLCSRWNYSYSDTASEAMMWIGKNGMVVLAFHAYMIIIFNLAVRHFGWEETSWAVFAAKTAFIFIPLYVVVVPAFNKYLYFLIGKNKRA